MNKKALTLTITCLLLLNFLAQGQKRILSLEDAVNLARAQSTSSVVAETRKENSYWRFRTFRSNYVPQLVLQGIAPDFRHSVLPVEQNDGSYINREVNLMQSNLTLGLSQRISLTNTTVFMNSTIFRNDDFLQNSYNYGGDPIEVGISQPLFTFNQLKWDKKIEPLLYEESKRKFVEDMESVSQRVTTLFFNVLIAQVSLEIAKKNVQSNDTIYRIAEGRYGMGTLQENELLQLELNLMNSRQAVAQAELDLETSQLEFKTYLGITDKELELNVPSEIPQFAVDENVALQQARNNRQEAISFERRRLQSERNVAQATGETGLNATLYGTVGLSNQAQDFPGVYQNPGDQQRVRLGLSIPIVDWGRQKAVRKTAEADKKLQDYLVQQDEQAFDQEVFAQVKQFDMLRSQIVITQKADEISQKRYTIAKNRYLIGKITITDLSIALTDQDNAKKNYLNSLRNFWDAFFNLRRLTLYDFATSKTLYKPEE